MKKIQHIPLYIILILLIFSCSEKTIKKTEEQFDPRKAFVLANEKIEKKDYEGARTILLEIKNKDKSRKIAPLAQLKIADSYIKEDEPEMGIAEYRRFLEDYPDHQYAPYAQYQIGMAYFEKIEDAERGYGYAAKALEEFEKLKKMFPRNPYKEVIDIRIKQCRNTIAEYELLVGKFYYKKGSYNAALGRLEGLLKNYPEFKDMAEVLFYTGMSYKQLGKEDKAKEYLTRFIQDYPKHELFKKAKKELKKLTGEKEKTES